MASPRRAIDDRGAVEQLLHGEPHPGNVLSTKNGPLFIDLETCCRGPVEFGLAHVPEAVRARTTQASANGCSTGARSSLSRWSPRGAGSSATSTAGRAASPPCGDQASARFGSRQFGRGK
ncbi:phosphotransferase family protein [Streptomyces olivaceoviridis]|uniref:phosphotransferase family protein n=1 Tax=Streptomyces olivaceoviridis TaxID=1921 RepID=UPI00369C90C0